MALAAWILIHTLYLITSELRLDDTRKDFRSITWYGILCVTSFSFWETLPTAVAMSCVIACFFVICVIIHRIVMLYAKEQSYWMWFLMLNNILISATIYIYG